MDIKIEKLDEYEKIEDDVNTEEFEEYEMKVEIKEEEDLSWKEDSEVTR